jgi:hypothetical protein
MDDLLTFTLRGRPLDKRGWKRQVALMNKNNLPGLSPLWLIALALALGIFVLTSIPLLVSVNVINSTAWIGFSGSVIGGAIAIVAVVVATLNVRRQLRVNLLSREEERMEAALPGLREVAAYLEWIRPELIGARHIVEVLTTTNGSPSSKTIEQNIRGQLPNADETSAIQLIILLESIANHATEVSWSEKRLATANNKIGLDGLRGEEVKAYTSSELKNMTTGHNLRESVLQTSIYNLEQFEKTIVTKIALFEERLPRFRKEMENYFEQ